MSGTLIVVSGPSGVGKTTIVRQFLDGNPTWISRSVSATTRQPRPGEKEGVNYRFMTEEQFRIDLEAGRFLEHAEIYGRLYGTPRGPVEEALKAGRSLILEIDVQGAESVRTLGLPAKFIFVTPPSLENLKERLVKRGTPPEEMERRLKEAEAEMAHRPRYDATVINETVDDAVADLKRILKQFGILKNTMNLIESRMDKQRLDELTEKVGGKANLILIIQKRVHELIGGATPTIENPPSDLLDTALEEAIQEKIDLTPPPPPPPPKPKPKPAPKPEARRANGRRGAPPRQQGGGRGRTQGSRGGGGSGGGGRQGGRGWRTRR